MSAARPRRRMRTGTAAPPKTLCRTPLALQLSGSSLAVLSQRPAGAPVRQPIAQILHFSVFGAQTGVNAWAQMLAALPPACAALAGGEGSAGACGSRSENLPSPSWSVRLAGGCVPRPSEGPGPCSSSPASVPPGPLQIPFLFFF